MVREMEKRRIWVSSIFAKLAREDQYLGREGELTLHHPQNLSKAMTQ